MNQEITGKPVIKIIVLTVCLVILTTFSIAFFWPSKELLWYPYSILQFSTLMFWSFFTERSLEKGKRVYLFNLLVIGSGMLWFLVELSKFYNFLLKYL